jgi:hypothetical protein|tara:strand:- start:3421 stop:3948 length:528 start_codon:yes stop_codon:yes gene_type:complete
MEKVDTTFEITKTLEFVNDFFGFDISVKSRKREIVEGRMMYAKLMKRYSNHSLSAIGAPINKDHATIIHYNNNFAWLKKNNVEFARKFEILNDMYDEFRAVWFNEDRFDEKSKIIFLQKALNAEQEKVENYEKYLNRIKRLDSIIQLIEQRTPRGEEEYAEQKINRMFNSIIFNT